METHASVHRHTAPAPLPHLLLQQRPVEPVAHLTSARRHVPGILGVNKARKFAAPHLCPPAPARAPAPPSPPYVARCWSDGWCMVTMSSISARRCKNLWTPADRCRAQQRWRSAHGPRMPGMHVPSQQNGRTDAVGRPRVVGTQSRPKWQWHARGCPGRAGRQSCRPRAAQSPSSNAAPTHVRAGAVTASALAVSRASRWRPRTPAPAHERTLGSAPRSGRGFSLRHRIRIRYSPGMVRSGCTTMYTSVLIVSDGSLLCERAGAGGKAAIRGAGTREGAVVPLSASDSATATHSSRASARVPYRHVIAQPLQQRLIPKDSVEPHDVHAVCTDDAGQRARHAQYAATPLEAHGGAR